MPQPHSIQGIYIMQCLYTLILQCKMYAVKRAWGEVLWSGVKVQGRVQLLVHTCVYVHIPPALLLPNTDVMTPLSPVTVSAAMLSGQARYTEIG